jgi:hypothetical protein
MPRLKTKLEKYAFCLIGRRLSEDHLVVKIEAGVNGHGFFNLQEEASSQALGSASLSPGDKWFRPRRRRGSL